MSGSVGWAVRHTHRVSREARRPDWAQQCEPPRASNLMWRVERFELRAQERNFPHNFGVGPVKECSVPAETSHTANIG